MVHEERPVPEGIPGQLVRDPEKLAVLKEHFAGLCGMPDDRFPGSQPVSFERGSLDLLEKENFWVCEKSDGVRVLILILAEATTGQEVFLIDRKSDFYYNEDMVFPHQDGPGFVHSNTVLDGELVIDVDPQTRQHHLRLLAFDCLVLDGANLMMKSMDKRYGRLKEWVIAPYKSYMQQNPEAAHRAPFEVVLKLQELSYGIEAVFKDHLPRLQHGNDGLIFTSAEAPYTSGTDSKVLKWKPPSENSIDFLLQLKFPPSEDIPSEVDWAAKPVFMLMMNCGREGISFFDTMEVEDDEWEEWKKSRIQYDDRIVEVVWNAGLQTWRMLRFRDDKHEGNYKSVVTAILKSIKDGVEADDLIQRAGAIRKSWKLREQSKKQEEEERQRQARHVQQSQQKRMQQQQAAPQQWASSSGGSGGGVGGARVVGGIKR